MKLRIELLTLPLAGCAPYAVTSSPSSEARGYNYSCDDGTRFSARGGGESITLIFPDRTLTLPKVRSGSGEKHTDRKLLFWNKGDEAILATGSHGMLHCRSRK